MLKPVIFALILALTFDVCGYKRAGRGKGLPADIKTLAVPVFQNSNLKYRVEQRFTSAVIEEILRRARALKVTDDTDSADAVISGDIRRFQTIGTILDSQGRTRVWSVRITVSVTVRDQKRKKIIYENPRLIFEGEYELSDDPQSFFNEENPAVDRIAKDFAQTVISTVLEGR